MLGVTTMLNFFTTSNGFRSNLPVVSNLTAMNLWDAVCMFFIYTSFLEFVVVNYLARWVQDPETQKRKRDNAILDSLRIVTTTLDLKHPGKPGTLGAGLLHLDSEMKSKLKNVKEKIPTDLAHKFPGTKEQKGLSEDSTVTMLSSCGSKYDDDTLEHGEHLPLDVDREPSLEPSPKEEEPKGYSLIQVKKIDVYSRRIFPILFFIFVFYFFIRYHAIEGALSIEYPN
eukprot:TRINITY_DN10360_c0_g1_i2.p1 TRINITY_DN10360_c0_g1~~TRINITY_DN10360_c0_g1_i2.p1  ORF type:complete len:227 (+),score=53.56 TRINITY_DN10360_c0_g1_i2:453-1133(+)